MKFGIICCLVICGALWSSSVFGAQRNIFDDDWTPPKSSSTTRPSAIAPIKPPEPEKAVPKANGVSQSTPKARRPIPVKEEQSASRQVMKEVFSDQLAEHSIAARRKLSLVLLAQSDQSADKAADQFVLLAAAIDAALDAADLTLALQAADRMARAFEVDEWALKSQTAAQIGQKNATPDLAAENVRAGMKLAAELTQADDLASAARVYAAIVPLAAANPELRASLQMRQRDLAVLREAAEKVLPLMEKLRTDPQDPSANLEVGKYLCFFRSDWEKGLGGLGRGNNPDLKALALQEIAAPMAADDQMVIADAWWDFAQSSVSPVKQAIEAHAAYWYRKAAPQLKGLSKAKAEKRIASIKEPPSRLASSAPIDLLKLINIDKDAAGGVVKRDGENLVISGNGRAIIPFSPKRDYRLQIKVMRRQGSNDILVYFPVHDTMVTLVLSGWGGLASGLEKVDDLPYEKNKTSVKPGKLVNEKWYDVAIAVSGGGPSADVLVQLDQKDYIHWHGAESELSPIRDVPARLKRERLIMLGSAHDAVDAFASVKIIEDSGK